MHELTPVAAEPPPVPGVRRLWHALAIVAVQWFVIWVPGWFAPGTDLLLNLILLAAICGAVAVSIWWLRQSGLRWSDRLLVIAFFAASAAVVLPFCHPTYVYRLRGPVLNGLPLVITAWVLWLLVSQRLSWPARRVGILAAIALAWGYCTLLRIDGVNASYVPAFQWRWMPTAEDKFLAELPEHKTAARKYDRPELHPGDWPGFRGPSRDGCVTGIRIRTDWLQNPPTLLWRRRIGPGWSSFAVVGNRLYTQEQRGSDEAVVCYDADTGEEIWIHTDAARFSDVVGGAGPRATPTFDNGRLYTQGAAGRLNCLDASTGRPLWSRDVLADSWRPQPPQYGFASSPLVAHGIVTVFAGGPAHQSLLAYHASTGEPAGSAGNGRESYSSPQLVRIGGVDQVLMICDDGLLACDPERGKILWRHTEAQPGLPSILQPTRVGDSDVLVGIQQRGIRRLHIAREGRAWREHQVWQADSIKPYFDDVVVYKNHVYGSSSQIFACANLEDGSVRWRTRGYANSQLLLIVDQGILLTLSESGEVALLEASPHGPRELGRLQALEGKTWSHPVLAHGKLFLRNATEAACYELGNREQGTGNSE